MEKFLAGQMEQLNGMKSQGDQGQNHYGFEQSLLATQNLLAHQNMNMGMSQGLNMGLMGGLNMNYPGYLQSYGLGGEGGLNLDARVNYQQEYYKLYVSHMQLQNQMKELTNEKNDLMLKLNQLEKKQKSESKVVSGSPTDSEKKKRYRRLASEIERHYKCPSETCRKSYGSEGSLNQHLRLKHPEIAMDPDIKLKIQQSNPELDGNLTLKSQAMYK